METLQVGNLAVSPSTGLNQGSSLTITWDDTNAGNIPATVAWDDQVVIKNTTTGDTLVTADVLTDPNVLGPLAPGASIARQYAFTLPTGADGTGNIQVTVTANVDYSAFATATSLVNANLQTYANGGDYPTAPTTLHGGRGRLRPGARTGRRRAAWASSRPPAAGRRSTSRSTSPARPRSTR